MDPGPNSSELIIFSSLHIEVLGPRNLGKTPLANVCVADLVRAAEYEIRMLLRARNLVSGPQGIRTPIRRKATSMKDKVVRWRGEGVEYTALGGKVIQQV